MAKFSRMSVAQQLLRVGLGNTLIAVPRSGVYVVSRIRATPDAVALTEQGRFSITDGPIIGRVGLPDPALAIPWTKSMAFFGKWFDHIGETDPGYRLRRSISSLSHQAQLDQIGRDEQYALVGSYYSVFRTILEVKRRAPLVLMDDALLPLASFPVILPRIQDEELQSKCMDMLGFMLRPDKGYERPVQPHPLDPGGIVLDEDESGCADDVRSALAPSCDGCH